MMNRLIDIYINGVKEFRTSVYSTCQEAVKELHAAKHIRIASLPADRYITIYDYDKVVARYVK